MQNADGTYTAPGLSRQPGSQEPVQRRLAEGAGRFPAGGALDAQQWRRSGHRRLHLQQLPGNPGTQIYPVNKFSIKGDHIFNEKHRISGYYGNDREHQTYGPDGPPTLPGLYSNYNDLTQDTDVLRFSWDLDVQPHQD